MLIIWGYYMYLKRINLVSRTKNILIRSVEFKMGPNFIVDTEESSMHNLVGKTTFLKLIDILLGSKDKKQLYLDSDTNIEELALKQFIEENKVIAELIIGDSFKNGDDEHTLIVELYNRGKYLIDSKRYNINDYRKKLNCIIFKNFDQSPTFRKLIHSFIRITDTGYSCRFLKNIPMAKVADYRGIYNYLFNISNPINDEVLRKEKDKLKLVKTEFQKFKNIHNIVEIEQIAQVIESLEFEKENIQIKLNDIINEKDFVKNREKINSTRETYEILNKKKSALVYQLLINKEIEEEISQEKISVEDNVHLQLFEELKILIPDINKTFRELLEFNNALKINRIKYLKESEQAIEDEIKKIENKQNELMNGEESLITLVKNNKLENYEIFLKQLSEREYEIKEKKKILNDYQTFENEIARTNKLIESMSNQGSEEVTANQMMLKFNTFFTPYAEKINGERPYLTYITDNSKFPIAITQQHGTSTGTKKSLMAAYDLAYQSFASSLTLSVPQFIVHDVVENIESSNLSEIIDISLQSKSQFIAGILRENLDLAITADNTKKQEYTILELSMDDRLFESTEFKERCDH